MNFETVKSCNNKGGVWKLLAILLFFAFIGMAVSTFLLKIKNDKYKSVLLKESESFPNTPEQEAELKEIRKREWRKKHALKNRKTVEERLEENRIEEAE